MDNKEEWAKSAANRLNDAYTYLRAMKGVQTKKELAGILKVSEANISSAFKGSVRYLTVRFLEKLCDKFPELNPEYLIENKGMLLRNAAGAQSKNLVPLYDATTLGKSNPPFTSLKDILEPKGILYPTECIDIGGVFQEATAAVRHFDEGMPDYPPGCILALKEVRERQLIVWGKNYVIETAEYRIARRVQSGIDDVHVCAYGTNEKAYPDGKSVHEPLSIAWDDIRRIFLILGYIAKLDEIDVYLTRKIAP